MSISYEVYVGAYAEVDAEPVTVTQKELVCPNNHPVTGKWAFCPHCGRGLALETITERRFPYLSDLLTEDEDEYYRDWLVEPYYNENGPMVLIGNWHPDALDHHWVAYQTSSRCWASDVLCIRDVLCRPDEEGSLRHKAAFDLFFGELLDLLAERAESVNIRFGVVTYYV